MTGDPVVGNGDYSVRIGDDGVVRLTWASRSTSRNPPPSPRWRR